MFLIAFASAAWSAGWLKSTSLKQLQCYSSGLCVFKTAERDSTWFWFDGTSESGKNMLLLLVSLKTVWTPFQIYDSDTLLPGTKYRRADGVSLGEE